MIIPEGQIFHADFSTSFGPSHCLVANSSSELWKWHRRLGHLSFDLLSHLSSLDLVRGLPMLKFECFLSSWENVCFFTPTCESGDD